MLGIGRGRPMRPSGTIEANYKSRIIQLNGPSGSTHIIYQGIGVTDSCLLEEMVDATQKTFIA